MNHLSRFSRSRSAAFVSVFALGAFLRLVGLGDQSLYLDEAYSVWFATRDWHYLWQEVPQFESHPPLYYSILKVWMWLGQDEGVIRLPSALISIATLPLMFLLGRFVGGDRHGFKVGLVAMLAFAVNPAQIDHAQDARPYAFWIFALALALAGLAWLVRNPTAACLPPSRWTRMPAVASAFGALSIGLSLLPWLHNVGLIYVASIACFCALWWAIHLRMNRTAFLNLTIVGSLALVSFLPYIPMFLSQATGLVGKWAVNPPSPLRILETSAQLFGYWDYSVLRLRIIAAFNILPLVMACLGLVALWRRRDGAFVLLLCSVLLLPWATILLLSLTLIPIFELRLILPVFIPWAVLMAASVLVFSRPLWSGLAALVIFAVYGSALPVYYTIPIRFETWDRIVQTIVDHSEGTGVIFASPNTLALALGYYLKKQGSKLDLVPLPAAYPARDPSYSHPWGHAVAGVDRRSVETMRRAIGESDSIWLVRRVQSVFDPDDVLLGYLSARFCLRRYLGVGADVFQVTRRREPASASCIEDTLVETPVCPGALTRLARSSLGCLGPEADVSHCPRHQVRCRLDFE